MNWAEIIVQALKDWDTSLIAYVPDISIDQVTRLIDDDPFFHLVSATREEEAIGIAVWVDEESLIDTVTAVSGSGPAYFFYLMDAMVKAAQEGGLNPDASRQLTLQTALGAAQLALASGESLTELRRRVTSPGGTTQAAVEMLDKNGCEEILIRAVHAARERSVELAKLLGE